MRNSVFFIIFLIAPIAFCQSEVLELIEKTKEGKQVLNTLYLQSKLLGDNLETGTIANSLKATEDSIIAEHKAATESLQAHDAACNEESETVKRALEEAREAKAALSRRVEGFERESENFAHVLQRSHEEGNNYSTFAGFANSNLQEWTNFCHGALDEFRNVHVVLEKVRTCIVHLAEEETKTGAFIQLGKSYYSTLSEVRSDIENANHSFKGLKPAFINLVEIMQKDAANSNPKLRLGINEAFHAIAEVISDERDSLEEDCGVLTASNEALVKVFQGNAERVASQSAVIEETIKDIESRRQIVAGQAGVAGDIVAQIEGVYQHREDECVFMHLVYQEQATKFSKMLSISEQVHEILSEEFGTVRSYFIQRAMKSGKRFN